MTIYKTFTFEASHVLPKHPGKCSRLHGHSWKLTIGVEGPVNKETGFVVDYADLKKVVENNLINLVDHHHLGQGDLALNLGMGYQGSEHYEAAFGRDFYPSSENLVIAFMRMLKPIINELNVELEEVSLDETCTCRATWRRIDG